MISTRLSGRVSATVADAAVLRSSRTRIATRLCIQGWCAGISMSGAVVVGATKIALRWCQTVSMFVKWTWRQSNWMPDSCAYRLRFEGKELFEWHPLIAGSREKMAAAGILLEGRVISEEHVHPEGFDEHIIRWVET